MTEKDNGPEGFADEAKAVEDFLQFLPKRLQQYSKDCVVYNAATGRYEDAVSSNETTNSGTTSPLDGRRAPPPTPATLAAALETSNTALEIVPEEDSITLVMPSRAASPEPWPAINTAQVTPSSNVETAGSTVVLTPTIDSKSPATQGWDVIAAAKLADNTEAAKSKTKEDGKADEASAAPTTEFRNIDPTTATLIDAFTFLSANDGNKGLEASKFAKPIVFPSTSSSSRTRLSPLAVRDPNVDNVRSDRTFQDRVVQAFRQNSEDEMSKVRFVLESTDGKPPVEVAPTTSPKLGEGGYAAPSKMTTAHPATITAATQTSAISSAGTKVESTTEITTAANGEDRQHAVYFANWGAPAARTGPQAEVRRVIVKGLPAAIENPHVASMFHGGALESYVLIKNPTSAVATAVATFTSGDAAKAFYDKYPNGLEMKIMGKKTVAIVEMGDSVDVVSGVLRGYLESGATRVVRADGADEDWAMRALRKIAEEKGRKLEAILDTSIDEGRTIEFRFTNIADAVSFRGSLIRSADWEDCNIQFVEDPCARKV